MHLQALRLLHVTYENQAYWNIVEQSFLKTAWSPFIKCPFSTFTLLNFYKNKQTLYIKLVWRKNALKHCSCLPWCLFLLFYLLQRGKQMARKFNLDWLQSLNKKNVLHFKHDMSALLHHFIAAFSFKYILRLCFSESHFFLCSQAESAVAHMGELSCLKWIYVIYYSICKTWVHQDSVMTKWQMILILNSNIWYSEVVIVLE